MAEGLIFAGYLPEVEQNIKENREAKQRDEKVDKPFTEEETEYLGRWKADKANEEYDKKHNNMNKTSFVRDELPKAPIKITPP